MLTSKKRSEGLSCVGADRVGGRSVGSGSYFCAEDLSLLSLSLVVLSANLIVPLIISVFGFHFSKGPSFDRSGGKEGEALTM